MSEVKWTAPQKDAIKARDGSILVSAAAGSGKTAVLVERIIQAITAKDNPVSIDKMLIVTFTRAASAEMRGRIEQALNKLLKSDPYNSHLLKQKQLLYNAQISTIDGFCTTFVRQYFYKLGIQSDFRVADDGELKILQSKALDNTLEYFYQQNDKDFISLVDAVCTYRSDEQLRNFITKTYNFLTSIPFMDSWLEQMLGLYNIPFEETPYFKYIMNYADECIAYCKELACVALSYLEQDDFLKPDQIDKIRTFLNDEVNLLNTIGEHIETWEWNTIKSAVENIKFKKFPTIRNSSDDTYKEIIKNIRDDYKKEIKSLSELFFVDRNEIGAQTEKLYPIINAFINCVLKFREEFSALKNAKNILDFSDIEMYMVELLCRKTDDGVEFTDISEEISELFDCVIVDEFQDVNDVQDLIFRAVCRGRDNLFVVGDVKQSIYGFRQAKPDIFIRYKENYSKYNRELNNYPAKIILDKNFRSRKGVTDACNFVFSTLMSTQVGGIDYDDGEALAYGAEYPDINRPAMEFMMVDTSDLDTEHNEDSLLREARAVADKINEMLSDNSFKIYKDKELRPLKWGDIAILIRSPKSDSRAVTFVNVLKERGIPAVSQEKNSFFDLSEIKVMLNMLRVIDNPLQDIPVLSVLMSPMFGFTADDMAEIRVENKDALYLAVKSHARKNAKSEAFVDFVDKMRTLSVTTTVDRLIGIIMQTLSYDAVIMAIKNAQAKNLYLLQEYARDFAKNGYITLSSFINYIDRLCARGGDLNSCDDSGDGLNAVSVMSIHASKGLEFPVCFVCCTSTKFNTEDIKKDFLIDADNGIGFRVKEELIKYDTVQRKVLSLMMKDSFISEEMRVLYVAMTRAKERLIITASSDKPDKTVLSVETKLTSFPVSSYVVKKFNSFSEWIIACCLAHPSCDELRTNISADMSKYPDGNYIPWTVTRVTKKSLLEHSEKENATAEKTQKTNDVPLNDKFVQEFNDRINYIYPNAPLVTLPQKVSASQLAHKDNSIFNKILRKPQFLSDKKNSGAEKGTAFHAFMERCEIKNALSDSRKEAERLVNAGFFTESQLEMLDYAQLDNFLKSELIERVLNAEEYHREYRFAVKINSSDYDSDIPAEFAENKIIMQGAVDLAFVEDGEIVIVDYKTDRVKDISKLSEMYSKQVRLYKQALEETMEHRVKEVIIYSVYLGEQIKIDI